MTTPDERDHQIDPLGRYWNEIVAGVPASLGDDALDPTLAATVRHVQAVGAGPTPDPAFAARLWEELMHQSQATPPAHPHLIPGSAADVNGRPPAKRDPAPTASPRPRRWWPPLELAAATLLIVALAGALLALRGDLPGRLGSFGGEDDPPASDTVAQLSFGNVVDVPASDSAPIEVVLRRVTLAPGATWEVPPGSPRAGYLESGTLVVRIGAEGGGGTEESRWRPGYGGASSGIEESFHNDGDEPAVLLHAMIGPGVRALQLPSDVMVEELGGGVVDSLPIGPALLTVTGYEVAAANHGEQVDTGRDGLALVAVEAGTLSLFGQAGRVEMERAAQATESAADRRSGDGEVPLAAGDSALLQDGAFFTMVNRGDTPVRFLLLTVEPNAAVAEQQPQSIAASVYGTPPPTEPRATPTADAEVVAPEECDVEPQSSESIAVLVEAAAVPATPVEGLVDTPYEDELPEGMPADAATVAALTEVEREFIACYNAGDLPRVLALVTDETARELLIDVSPEDVDALEGFSTPLPEDERIALFPLRGARVLPDGRVGAIVEWATPDEPRTVYESNFRIYVQVDGRWLLDDEISFMRYP